MAHVFGCIGFFGMTALAAGNDSAPVTVWMFGGVSVLALLVTLHAWRRFRHG